jgi:two-component system chemotaxis sensor kinase CheA
MNGYIETAGLLDDFFAEASGVISSIEDILCKLKRVPDDRGLLRDIHRGFHTLKGGAAYVNSVEAIRLCRLGEELLEELCDRDGTIPPWSIDAISAAAAGVRQFFSDFGSGQKTEAATDGHGQTLRKRMGDRSAGVSGSSRRSLSVARSPQASVEPDWGELHRALMQRLAPLGRIRATSSADAGGGPE